MTDECYMQRCFDLAERGAGFVSPNPLVGALLVWDGKIIGEGWHEAWGKAHAEVNCIQSVAPEHRGRISASTLYCSLEPCNHFGKTPPCVDLILQHNIPRVVVANTDPNPLVAGKGLDRLRGAGVAVTEGVFEARGKWLNRCFFTWITKNRPFVILKWAQSADGFLGKKGIRTAISGPLVQRLVHRWRSETDAILVGAGTATTDNPRLDVRYYYGQRPLRILLDGNGSVPADRHLLCDQYPALVFAPAGTNLPAHKTRIETSGAIPLSRVLEVLKKENRATLLVEGGAQVLHQFIEQGLWDEIRVIENPGRLGAGVKAPEIPAGALLQEKYSIGADTVSVLTPML